MPGTPNKPHNWDARKTGMGGEAFVDGGPGTEVGGFGGGGGAHLNHGGGGGGYRGGGGGSGGGGGGSFVKSHGRDCGTKVLKVIHSCTLYICKLYTHTLSQTHTHTLLKVIGMGYASYTLSHSLLLC
jgi:hypothetical protein